MYYMYNLVHHRIESARKFVHPQSLRNLRQAPKQNPILSQRNHNVKFNLPNQFCLPEVSDQKLQAIKFNVSFKCHETDVDD